MLTPQDIDEICKSNSISEIKNIVVTEESILESIAKIKIGSSAGPDSIPPILIKNCANALKTPLKVLFEKTLETGRIPDALKNGRIIPIHKRWVKVGPTKLQTDYSDFSHH